MADLAAKRDNIYVTIFYPLKTFAPKIFPRLGFLFYFLAFAAVRY